MTIMEEIKKMVRYLVEEAYREGYFDGGARGDTKSLMDMEDQCWEESNARNELEDRFGWEGKEEWINQS